MFTILSRQKRIVKIFITACCFIFALIGMYFYYHRPTNYLKVIFFDIGQGDSVFIETPDKFQILIDGGPDNNVIYKLGHFMPFYDRTIDLIIVSHPHDDHLIGLVEVLKRYKVKKILITKIDYYTPAYVAFLVEAKNQNIKIDIASEGWEINFGDNLNLDIIYPFASLEGMKFENINNSSIVMKLSYNQIDFLFTGDAEVEEEQEILSANIDLESAVLKAGHHGSDTSSSKAFLEAVDPEYASISVGADNSFGHPSLRTVNRMKRMDIKALRTDLLGDIKIFTDGDNIYIND